MNNISGVEIFSSGVWNGDEYTIDDLHGMVEAFNKNKQTLRPFLKLGHDDNQELLQKDGYPAAGWIDRLYVIGEKLVADFIDIPQKVYDLIKNKAYRNVSSEIFWNVKIKDQYHKHMLGAVALLGADTPAVMNLNDILAMYSFKEFGTPRIYLDKKYEIKPKLIGAKNMSKTEKEIQLELELKQKTDAIEASKAEYTKVSDLLKQKDHELSELQKYKKQSEENEIKLKAEVFQAKLEKFSAELMSEKLCTPGMKPYILAILGEDKKEYSFKIGNEEKKLESKQEILKEALKLFAAAKEVNFQEETENKNPNGNKEKELDAKIKQYSKEHNLPYGQAMKIVLSQNK